MQATNIIRDNRTKDMSIYQLFNFNKINQHKSKGRLIVTTKSGRVIGIGGRDTTFAPVHELGSELEVKFKRRRWGLPRRCFYQSNAFVLIGGDL